ncbi:MAG: 16S rRNA (cytosine(967)-C(5))-methyltransferase RsmB, partial [Thermodesulfobacteriota bacterium]
HPEWLVRTWRREFGDERLERLLAADDEPAPTVVRVDRRVATPEQAAARLGELGIEARPAAFARDALVVEGPLGRLAQVPGVRLQGEASQLVVDLLDPRAGERVLDLCAAPGGKSGAIDERIGEGRVFAADRSRPGMRRVAALAAASGSRILPLVADASRPPLKSTFDGVLVDAPCSGLGTLRAHPEIRWRRRPEDLPRIAARQCDILDAAAALVRPGGRLVYSTCTIAAVENEQVTDAFLAGHPAFHVEDARRFLPAAASALVDARGALRTSPDVGGLDGFYAVRLARAALTS